MSGVNELVQRWRDFAMQDVPKDYSERGLTQKYLRGDNAAGGAWDAADELEEVARTAWHPVSEPPTEVDADNLGYIAVGSTKRDSCALIPYWEFVENIDSWAPHIRWARINDVVLQPPA